MGPRITIGLLVLLIVAGCSAYRPIFDPKFIRDSASFENDLSECQAIARNGGIGPASGAAIGAVAGGGLGAGVGAIAGTFTGRPGLGAGIGGALGGLSGLASGVAVAAHRERTITTNCMIGRGYRPLY